jgi:hypothetical protein
MTSGRARGFLFFPFNKLGEVCMSIYEIIELLKLVETLPSDKQKKLLELAVT